MSKKRNLLPETETTPNSTSTERNRTSKMSSKEIQELKDLIKSSSETIENKIAESQETLEKKFADLASEEKVDVASLKTSVSEIQHNIVGEINEVKSQLNNHDKRIANTEDDIQRIKLCTDLRLIGFAWAESENIQEIFNKIAAEIGFATDQLANAPTIERIPTKNRTTGQIMQSPTIFIHFAMLRQKQMFYSHYLNKMPLNHTTFGLTDSNRIVIGENLTKKNAQLFKQAQILRKDRKIAQTFTEDGLVKIRFAKGKNETTYTVRDRIELEFVVAQHESQIRSSSATHNAHGSDGMQPTTAKRTAQNTDETQKTNNEKTNEVVPMEYNGEKNAENNSK